MTTLVVVGLGMALLYVMGYRFDSQRRTLDQGGLIQIESRPSGARVHFDGQRLSGTTPRQVNASAGSHTVRITRDNYRPWQKTIAVEAGGVHWLNYGLMIPEDPKITKLTSFPSVAAASPVPGSDRMLIMESNRQPVFQQITLSGDIDTNSLELPSEIRPSGNGRYIMHTWSDNGRALLLEYRQAKSSRWYVLDTRDDARSIDISAIVGANLPLEQVNFTTGSDRLVYGLSDGAIRRIDANSRTVSAPLVENVASYWQGNSGVLTYVSSHDKKAKTRELGYLTRNATKPRVIQTVYTDADTPLRVVIGQYQSRYYLAVQNDETISVSRVNLYPSDSDRALDMTNIAVINTEDTVDHLTFSPHNRFIVAQHDATYMTYDIELDRFTSTTLRGTEKVSGPVKWLDLYHIWSTRDGQLRTYEFDGENVQSFGQAVPGLAPQLSRNSEKLFVFLPAADGVELTQISLRVE